MNRDVVHRVLIAVELLVLALPTSVICMVFSLALMLTVSFPWSLADLLLMHWLLLCQLGIVGLWWLGVAYLRHRQAGLSATLWWWRAACMGAVLLGVSLLLPGLFTIGWEAPEVVIIMATGSLASPLLVPFLHLAYLRRVAVAQNAAGPAEAGPAVEPGDSTNSSDR